MSDWKPLYVAVDFRGFGVLATETGEHVGKAGGIQKETHTAQS